MSIVKPSVKLKACPFCGGKDIEIRQRKMTLLECKGCGALFIRFLPEQAISAWNKRK